MNRACHLESENMRREGRQHGMVLTHPVNSFLGDTRPIPKRVPNQVSVPLIGGIYTKVPSKPTNSSKYTSRCGHRPRCGGCHNHPVNKARAKRKGNHKHKDEIADFLLEWDCHRADEELNYTSDDGDEFDDGDEAVAAEVAAGCDDVVCQEGGGGDCEDEGWVLVEGVRVSDQDGKFR